MRIDICVQFGEIDGVTNVVLPARQAQVLDHTFKVSVQRRTIADETLQLAVGELCTAQRARRPGGPQTRWLQIVGERVEVGAERITGLEVCGNISDVGADTRVVW